jgi:hypothetical protein
MLNPFTHWLCLFPTFYTSFFFLFATIAIFGEKKEHDYVKEKHNCTKQAQKMNLCEFNGCDGQRTQHETHFMVNKIGNNNFKAHWVVLCVAFTITSYESLQLIMSYLLPFFLEISIKMDITHVWIQLEKINQL